jgi:hydrogenase expression/formation protein HypD
VITGFEPLDVLDGIRRCVLQLEAGRAAVENAYERAVRPEGNLSAQRMLEQVFDTGDRQWRGIGTIAQSGWNLSAEYADYDAARRFDLVDLVVAEPTRCRAGDVLQGRIKPSECECFGGECTPRTPLGAPMVSSEGACAAYHQYRRLDSPPAVQRG